MLTRSSRTSSSRTATRPAQSGTGVQQGGGSNRKGVARSSPSQRSNYTAETETMQQPLEEHALAPESPPFGVEMDFERALADFGPPVAEFGGGAGAFGGGVNGEFMSSRSPPSSLPSDVYLSLEEIFPSSPPYASEDEGESYSSCGGDEDEALPPTPPRPIDVSPSPSFASPILPELPAYSSSFPALGLNKADVDYQLLNEMLYDQGLEQIHPSSSFHLDYTGPVPPPPAPALAFPAADPYSHRTFDAQLASPLFETSPSPPYHGDAWSPGSPYRTHNNGFGGAGSASVSPVWSDAISPAELYSPGPGSGSMSPEMGGLSLFGGLGLEGMSMSMSMGTAVNGADSTGASHANQFPAELLYSPVVSPAPRGLTPTASPFLDDIDVSPVFLPQQLLPAAPSLPPLPSTTSPTTAATPAAVAAPSDTARSPEASSSPDIIEEEDDGAVSGSDDDYTPVVKRESSAGPQRSTRRASSIRRASSPPSSSSPAAVDAPPPGLKVALNAPITKRVYTTTSRTSAKPIPKNLAKQIAARRAKGEVVDEDEAVAEADRKRKKNTLSARQSRAKKAMEVEGLKGRVRELEGEKEGWSGERENLERRVGELEREVEGLKRRVEGRPEDEGARKRIRKA